MLFDVPSRFRYSRLASGLVGPHSNNNWPNDLTSQVFRYERSSPLRCIARACSILPAEQRVGLGTPVGMTRGLGHATLDSERFEETLDMGVLRHPGCFEKETAYLASSVAHAVFHPGRRPPGRDGATGRAPGRADG